MMPLKELGLIEPEEERRQWVFHVMVSDKYAQTRDDKPALAVEAPKFVPQSEASAEVASRSSSLLYLCVLSSVKPCVLCGSSFCFYGEAIKSLNHRGHRVSQRKCHRKIFASCIFLPVPIIC